MIVDFESAEKQKLCTHEFSFVKSQKHDFALILFVVDQQTKFPGLPIFGRIFGVTEVFETYRLLQTVLFLTDSVFRVLFAYFNESMASKRVYKPQRSWNTVVITPI